MKELLDQIEKLTTTFQKDACSQLDKGNKAAGLREIGRASCRERV